MITLTLMDSGNILFEGKICAVALEELHLHEEILEPNVVSVMNLLRRKQLFQDPIIVDENSLVVLDGMHRVTALRRLNYDFIIAYLVDYFNPLIKVRRWCRIFSINNKVNHSLMENLISSIRNSFDADVKLCKVHEGEALLNEREVIGYLYAPPLRETYCISCNGVKDIMKIYRLLREIESHIASTINADISYAPDESINDFSSEKNLILVPPQIKKIEVIRYATKGIVFPPKTTRHIIPLRPFFVNIPLNLLRKSHLVSSLKRLNNIIDTILLQKEGIRLQGKIIIDRFYEDDFIYIFL